MVAHHESGSVYDAIIIGAGVTGVHQLYSLLQRGLNVRLYDAAGGVGGTWYWNRYPGARFDSESYSYAFGFSQELLDEWQWSEHFAGQPEIERYINHVVDRFQLRPHIQLNARIACATYDERAAHWTLVTEVGERATAQFVIAAVGFMSAPFTPDINGMERFEGRAFHTARWPHDPIDFSDKRVGVIGTGPTAVQVIQEVSKSVGQLTVFQRTPVYACPLRNGPIEGAEQEFIQSHAAELLARSRLTYAGFLHENDPRAALEVPADERQAHFEAIWAGRGFSKWHANFYDTFTHREANELYADFVRQKARERIKDPRVAEKLLPKSYPFGAKRVPMESGYYEAYNRENVELVDLRETPIECITPRGVKTSAREYPLDYLIYGTGFDAITGEFTRMDIRGEGGQALREEWAAGMRNYLGLQVAGFPNFFIANAAVFSNVPRASEIVVDWITDCIAYVRANGFLSISTSAEAEARWAAHAESTIAGAIFTEDESSWFMGANIPGKKREFLLYGGGCAAYRQKCAEVAQQGYEGFQFAR